MPKIDTGTIVTDIALVNDGPTATLYKEVSRLLTDTDSGEVETADPQWIEVVQVPREHFALGLQPQVKP